MARFTNLRFHQVAAECKNDLKALVLAMQKLNAEEPHLGGGYAAGGWLLRRFGPHPAPDPGAGDALFQELFG